MFNIFQNPHSMYNDETESFGVSGQFVANALMNGFTDKQRVMFKPLSGTLLQKKCLHLKYWPPEYEFDLADATNPIVSIVDAQHTAANTSYLWHLGNWGLEADVSY